MPRNPEPIVDATPLTGARIDVAARIGWLLRSHRRVAGVSLREMAVALQDRGVIVSAATLSRIESEGQRPSSVLDAWGPVLGLPGGVVRAATDLLCRSFTYAGPPVLPAPSGGLVGFTLVCDAVAGESVPSAGHWLDFAVHHARPDGFGLPLSSMGPLVDRLLDEVGRGVGPARMVRLQAIATLLESEYAALTEAAIRRLVDDPDHQNFYDLTAVISDRARPETLQWAGSLLSGPTLFHVRGASYVLQGMLVKGGLGESDWLALVPHLVRALEAAAGIDLRLEALETLGAALPDAVKARLREVAGVTFAAPQPAVEWSTSARNVHYAFAASIARAVTRRLDQGEEPLLARLLFESFFEPRGVRMGTAAWFLALSPFARLLVPAIMEAVDDPPDAASRAAALRVAAVCHSGDPVVGVEGLLDSDDPSDLMHGLTLVGRAGGALPEAALTRGLSGDETLVRQTLYCLGMAGDARLARVAADPDLAPATRRGARWWQEQGARIPV